nr:D(2) dopamine receptor A-like [Pocillopora verrucosa]
MDSELKQRSLALNILEPCILVAITMVCLIGNSLTCIAVYRNARLRTSTNLYLISLAVSDIIHAAIVMPLTAGVLIAGELPYGETVCDLFALFTQFSVYVSPTTMGLTAFNRYVRIVKPQHYSRIFTDARSKIYVAAVWLTIVGYISIPKMAGFTEKSFFAGHAVCIFVQTTVAMKTIHYIIVVCFFLLLPLVVASVSYYKVFKEIKHHNLNMASTAQAEGNENRLTVKEIKITKSLAIVMFTFILCWVPFWIIVVIERFIAVVPRNIQLLCPFLMAFSSTINPFIYAGMNPSFRAEFRRILLCKVKSSQVCKEFRCPKDVELKKISAGSARSVENQEE